jgi:uncharacterized phage protein (predicted DNA packaging)
MFIQLYQIKKHLNIDEDFHLDDEYLVDLSIVAEQVVQKHIDNNLDELCAENDGELPSPLMHAMLLLIGNFYANRESVAFASSSEIPLSYSYLLDLYKNYNNTKKNS